MTIPPADPLPTASAVPMRLTPAPPLDGFAPEEFRARRDALRRACPDGLILLRGQADDDVAAPGVYRQNSNFYYLTGVTTPGAYLLLLPEGVPASAGMRDAAPEIREILFLPAHDPYVETWLGARHGPGEAMEAATGITKAASASGLWAALTGYLRRCPLVYTATPYGENTRGTREYALLQKISELAPVAQFRDVTTPLARLRVVKSPEEQKRIAQAIAITGAGHEAARTLIESGQARHEYEVEAAILQAFRSRGGRFAFASIVGAGVNGTVLHYEDNAGAIQAGQTIVVDIGARWNGYCGDLTRTYVAGGMWTPRQREIYTLVQAAHENAVATYTPGKDSLKSLNDKCKAFLRDADLRATSADGSEQRMDTFMPHRLSHHLGLDVHDLSLALDQDEPLPVGSVITIEPGLYLGAEAIGVRLEDDYVVGETGLERLGNPPPL